MHDGEHRRCFTHMILPQCHISLDIRTTNHNSIKRERGWRIPKVFNVQVTLDWSHLRLVQHHLKGQNIKHSQHLSDCSDLSPNYNLQPCKHLWTICLGNHSPPTVPCTIFTILERFHILSAYKHKFKGILLEFYVINNFEVHTKYYMDFKIIYKRIACLYIHPVYYGTCK